MSPADLEWGSVLDCNSNRIGSVCEPEPQRELDAIFQNASCINKEPLLKQPLISSVNEVESERHGVG